MSIPEFRRSRFMECLLRRGDFGASNRSLIAARGVQNHARLALIGVFFHDLPIAPEESTIPFFPIALTIGRGRAGDDQLATDLGGIAFEEPTLAPGRDSDD